jgi:capsule polysaccharide modification protein KpsS
MTTQATIDALFAEGKIRKTDHSVHDLVSGADTVFTVNSGVGLEALLHRKSVVVTGECDYKYAVAGFASSTEALLGILRDGCAADETRIMQFLYYYKNFYSIDSSDHGAVESRLQEWLLDA